MANTYQPPASAVRTLDKIPILFNHPKTTPLKDHLIGKTFMCKFPDGQLYFESKLDLDTDGAAFKIRVQDRTSQRTTAAKDAKGKDLDANRINYFVLPGGFYLRHGIRVGDIGVVIKGDRIVYACFGDVGPRNKLGEGSIALHRGLGHETIVQRRHRERLINAGIKGGVITIVFPGSGSGRGRMNEESALIGAELSTAQKPGRPLRRVAPGRRRCF